MTEAMWQYLQGLAFGQALQRVRQAASAEATARLTVARQWPGFRQHEAAIARAMRADAELSLWEAYREVVLEGHQAEDGWTLTPEGFRRL